MSIALAVAPWLGMLAAGLVVAHRDHLRRRETARQAARRPIANRFYDGRAW